MRILKLFSVDGVQSDLTKNSEREGLHTFISILNKMPSFSLVEFGVDDIVRSGLVKEYIYEKLSWSCLMQFVHHNYLGDVELEKKEIEGTCFYHLPDASNGFPLLLVTSFYNRQTFIDWRREFRGKNEIKLQETTARAQIFTKSVKTILKTKRF